MKKKTPSLAVPPNGSEPEASVASQLLWPLWLTTCFLCWLVFAGQAAALTAKHYELDLRPDFENRALWGKARIQLQAGDGVPSELEVRAPNLEITKARLNGRIVLMERRDRSWWVSLPDGKGTPPNLELEVDYRAPAAAGLVFAEGTVSRVAPASPTESAPREAPEQEAANGVVYTAFHVCHWMPCMGSDLERATVEMRLTLPEGFRSVASGERLSATEGFEHRWKQSEPYPLYTFGFAAGRFVAVSEVRGGKRLRYLGLEGDPVTLGKKFKDSPRMLAFFEAKSGIPLPHSTYTQVLVPGAVAQEASSFALVGKQFLDPILGNPQEDWVIAHEMAHQWWGNLITCATWSDFWLNEGITVFMTAAWKQERWGEPAYQRELELARQRWKKASDAGYDKPLSWTGEYPDLRTKRAIHYSKGALFLHELRSALGEDLFWNGLRHYTQENVGQAVRGKDLQRAMETVAGKSLEGLFERWVYSGAGPLLEDSLPETSLPGDPSP